MRYKMKTLQAIEYIKWHKCYDKIADIIDMHPREFYRKLFKSDKMSFNDLELAALTYAVRWFVR